jgi:steroid delta-isomerase-like uncharacterized protein
VADTLIDAWERCWSGRDPARFAEVCTHDVHYEDPFTPAPLRGPDQIARHARRLWEAAPDARVNATGPRVATGAFISAPCRVLGTHTEAVGRITATGRAIDVHAVLFAETRDGRLYRVRAFFDVYGLARQLGVLPQPGTAGERALLMLRGFGLRG